MNSSGKQIVIINGVTGIIGSCIFSYFAEQGESIIYGTSRKGFYFDEYVDPEAGKLPLSNLVFSLADFKARHFEIDVENFIDALPDLPIVFIHTIGEYVTEMNRDGSLNIRDDHDGDGINDNVKRLTYEVPAAFCQKLSSLKSSVTFVQIGSLSDKYKIDIHGSWYRSMDLLKTYLGELCTITGNINALILNVSSVLTPKELIDRPFVSTNTDADMKYWLPPIEIAKFIDGYVRTRRTGLKEEELFRTWPKMSADHFSVDRYKARRSQEIYDSLALQHKNVLELSDGDSITYNFANPFHMDRLWGDLAIVLSRLCSKDQPIVYYNPHSWFFIVRSRTEHEIFALLQNEGSKINVVCGSDAPLDRATLEDAFKNYRHEFRISKSHSFGPNYYLNIYGDFMIEAIFDLATSNLIDAFYATHTEINSHNIKELNQIVSANGKNQLTVSNDHEKAERLRSELSKDF